MDPSRDCKEVVLDARSPVTKPGESNEPSRLVPRSGQEGARVLCSRCSALDFDPASYDFEQKSLLEGFCTLEDAVKETFCPLCEIIVSSWESTAAHSLGTQETKDITCDLDINLAVVGTKKSSLYFEVIFHHMKAGLVAAKSNLAAEKRHFFWVRIDIEEPREFTGVFDTGISKHWLLECDETGSLPRPQAEKAPDLPANIEMYVIDCVELAIVPLPHACHYLALSYVWGPGRANSIQSCTIESDRRLEHDALPATIRDAIGLTRDIGERYLWVDSLCLSNARPEQLSATIPLMGVLYKNAYLTIVAATGEDVHAGLSRYQRPADVCQSDLDWHGWILRWRDGWILFEKDGDDPTSHTVKCKWNRRGWTFQEYRLARRCIIFTRNEVLFTCDHGIHRERFVGKGHLTGRGHTVESLAKEKLQAPRRKYEKDVRDYTMRSFTYLEDRLDAFSGVLNHAHLAGVHDRHRAALSGLSLHSFQVALCWHWENTTEFSPCHITRIDMDKRRSRYLPSWSWVGWSGCIDYWGDGGPTWCEPVFLDDNNIFLAVSPSRFSHNAAIVPAQTPCRYALHLWTKCLRATVKSINRCDSRKILVISLAINEVTSLAINSTWNSTTEGRIAISKPDLLKPGDVLRIAHVFTQKEDDPCYNLEGSLWLILEGASADTTRVGLVRMSLNEHERLSEYATDDYLRIL